VRLAKRAKSIGWKDFFFARKFAFCAAAGAVGSFPTFRLFANNAVMANGRFA